MNKAIIFLKFRISVALCFLLLLGTSLLQAGNDEKLWLVKEEFLSPDIENFDCHSSSLIETAEGQLCVVWKGGPGKGKSNIDIKENIGVWSSLSQGNGWSAPKEIVTVSDSVCWNPVMCKLPSGEFLLFYRIGPDPRRTVTFLKRSQDGGITWSEGEILPAGIFGPTKNKPLVTSQGTIFSPSSCEVGEPKDEYKATACWIEISEDQGVHWKKIGPLELPNRKFGVIEPALFYDAKGQLKMLCRDRAWRIGQKGYICEAISEDGGYSWSELKSTELPNPDSGFDLVDLGEGRIVLIYNHSHTERFPLHLAISFDGGNQWSEPFVLDQCGEFPAVIQSSDGMIHVTYAVPSSSALQRRIKHAVIDPTVLFALPD